MEQGSPQARDFVNEMNVSSPLYKIELKNMAPCEHDGLYSKEVGKSLSEHKYGEGTPEGTLKDVLKQCTEALWPPHYASCLCDAIDRLDDKKELLDLVCNKAALTKHANDEVGLPHPVHPIIPNIDWARKRWGQTTETAMERWMAPGITMSPIRERQR